MSQIAPGSSRNDELAILQKAGSSILRQSWIPIVFAVALIIISFQHYLAFHVLAEFFAVVVGVMMFVVVWHSYDFARNHFLMYLGTGYFWIGWLDVVHTLLYYGMPTALDQGNLTSQFWIATRFLEALLLVSAPLFLARTINRTMVAMLFGIIAGVTTASILNQLFPVTFIDGVGLTTFKVVSEYVIIAILLAAIYHLHRHRELIEPQIYGLLLFSIVLTIGAELAFTFYVSMYGLSNLVGHIFKIFSFWLIYVAIIRTSLTKPYLILNHDLRIEIDERRQLQAELLETQQLHEEAQQLAKLGHWSLDLTNNKLVWSNEIFRIFDIDSDQFEASYEAFIETIHPDDRDYVNHAYNESLRSKKPYDIVHRLLMKDRSIKFVREQCKTHYDERGTPLRSTGTVQDITEQKLAELALRESEERFDLAMLATNDGLWDWNLSTDEVYFAPRWKAMLGYKDSELSNNFTTWERLTEHEGRSHTMDLVQNCMAGKSDSFVSEFRMKHKDGHWVDILSRGTLVRDDHGKPIRMVGTHLDLSERKAAERALREKEQAEGSAEMKSRFLANMSHELRTPMNGIIGMTHLALQTELDEQQRNYVSKAHRSAENLLGILNDILDFSKVEAGKLEIEEIDFKIKDVVDNFVNLLRFKADERKIQLSARIDRNVPRALIGDPLRLSQILINLGSNAIKFSRRENLVALQVSLKTENGHHAELQFTVKDSGIGMSREEQERLFQPFSQADSSTTRKYGGTGLGLIISKNIAQMMHGEITFESEPGVGSTFTFTVPLKKQKNSATGQEASGSRNSVDPEISTTHLRGAKILLVEDNDINQELVLELLVMNDISVETANNGREALDLLAGEAFDGVLMDLQMPVMDGYEACRKIRQQNKLAELPVIAMTANAMKGDRKKALEAGMNDHIAKPIDPDLMFHIMAKWITPAK